MWELLSVVVRHNAFYHHGLRPLLDVDDVATDELDERTPAGRDERTRAGREREANEATLTPLYMRSSSTARPVPVARVLVQRTRARAGPHEHLPGKGVGDHIGVRQDRIQGNRRVRPHVHGRLAERRVREDVGRALDELAGPPVVP